MKIVLAYSGGLDTSVLLKRYVLAGHEVIAMTLDLGESDGTAGKGASAALDEVKKKAQAVGASDALVLDVKERFISEYAQPALRANALYEGVYPLSAALSRPLIAAVLVETAQRHHADAVAHGCTGKGNDQVRIEVAVRSLDPSIKTLAPLRDEPLSRPDAIAFAQKHNVAVAHTQAKPYSIDANLWGRAIEAGILEDPWTAPPEDAYAWTASPERRPAKPEEITIDFNAGVPSLNGLTGARMVAELNSRAGAHGVGRIDIVEDRVVGLKSREVYECPGSVTLIAAHKALERLVLTRDEHRFKAGLDQKYGELVYDGLWPSPLRTAIDAFNGASAKRMTGSIRVRLHQGSATVVGSRSPFALYDEKLATYGAGDLFRHDAASGFIELWGLPLEVGARVARKSPVSVNGA
ncbi:MAG TPA: argininosuccinate synthase [Candidatus Baltobacteraceae bacterium]|jgi:argininosuccinate synthase|nr:argininosuccinate synthase [Candidatus Baltobacteraceae bacterium]